MKIWVSFDAYAPAPFLQGRVVANNWFLKALVSYSQLFSEFWFFVGDLYEKQHFYHWHPYLKSDKRVKVFLREEALSLDFSSAVVHKPDLDIADFILWREVNKKRFPITGITHSLSYPRFVDNLWKTFLLARDSDCIICTSPTAKAIIQKMLSSFKEVFPRKLSWFKLSVIPLGIFVSDSQAISIEKKYHLKKQLGLDKKIVFLHFGRISEYSKADLLALLRVATRLKKQGISDFKIIIAGATGESNYAQVIKRLIENLGLLKVISLVTDPSQEDKKVLFSISDCLISISDNFQETFGLVILEAMREGLAIIATDWGGYRDIINNGDSGFLLPSYVIENVERAANKFVGLSYEMAEHLLWAQTVIIDEDELFRVMQLMCENRQLCIKMGQKAQKVVKNYDWRKIIPMYEQLWEDLIYQSKEMNQGAKEIRCVPRFDVRWFYELYPKGTIKQNCLLELSEWARDNLNQGLLLYEALSPVIDLEKVKRFLSTTGFPITLGEAKRVLNDFELSWLLKHNWLVWQRDNFTAGI